MRTNGDPFFLEMQRFNAARMFEQGYGAAAIAKALAVDDQTVRRWIREYQRGGIDALKAKLHPGPQPRLQEEQKQQFLALLQKKPSDYGLGGALWTTARMAALLQQRFGVKYHPSHVGQMMRELDYSLQLPHKRPRERNQEKIDQWQAQRWPEIVQRAREQQASIVFVDEAGFLMDPLRKRVWAPAGQTPLIEPRTRHHQKVSVIGGLVAGRRPQDLELLTQWHPDASLDQEGVVRFLKHLVQERKERLIVVWDNLPAHRSTAVKQFLREHPQLWLENLPGYAPELNPIESVWCMSKYHRMANHTIADVEALQATAQEAVEEVRVQKELLLNCIKYAGLAGALYPDGDQ